MAGEYQAVLIVSFGGPEQKADVIPFLKNVLRGKDVPQQRMLEIARHYERFDGYSPLNDQCRQLIAALKEELQTEGTELPIYWGNRNWHPMLADAIREMADDGIEKALAFVTSAFGSYSGCRQYLEDIERAQQAVGPQAPQIDKLRIFFNHPLLIEAAAQQLKAAWEQIPSDRRAAAHVAYTAHSLPVAMAECGDYTVQLSELCRLVSNVVAIADDRWKLVYQSRSGRPSDPWLEPDICDHLKSLRQSGTRDVVVMPIGFLSDHMEIIYDLDVEARKLCEQISLNMVRAATVGTHPSFVRMIGQLIAERMSADAQRPAIGKFGPSPDVCPPDCCPPPQRRDQ